MSVPTDYSKKSKQITELALSIGSNATARGVATVPIPDPNPPTYDPKQQDKTSQCVCLGPVRA